MKSWVSADKQLSFYSLGTENLVSHDRNDRQPDTSEIWFLSIKRYKNQELRKESFIQLYLLQKTKEIAILMCQNREENLFLSVKINQQTDCKLQKEENYVFSDLFDIFKNYLAKVCLIAKVQTLDLSLKSP